MMEIKKDANYFTIFDGIPTLLYVQDFYKGTVIFINLCTNETGWCDREEFVKYCNLATQAQLVLYGR